MDGTQYNLKYEKQYASVSINPWSQEELLKSGIRISANRLCLWIKTGSNAYCFLDGIDNLEDILTNKPASEAYDYLEANCDRKENINDVINYWK